MDYQATHLRGTPRRSQVAIMRPVSQAFPPNRYQMCLTRQRVTSSMASSLIHANQIESLPNLKCIVAVGCCRLSAATRQSTVYFDAIVTVGSHVAYIVVCRDLCLIVKILLSDNTQQYHNGVTGAIRRRFLSHARSAEKWLKAARLPRARLRKREEETACERARSQVACM